MLERLFAILTSRLCAGLLLLALTAGVWLRLEWALELLGWDPKVIFFLFFAKVGVCLVLGVAGLWLAMSGIAELID